MSTPEVPLPCIVVDVDDIGVEYRGPGPWKNYALYSQGRTLDELIEEAAITEVDQDGGELRTYGIDDCCGEVEVSVLKILEEELREKGAA